MTVSAIAPFSGRGRGRRVDRPRPQGCRARAGVPRTDRAASMARSKFTPEQVRLDDSRPGRATKIFYGGKRRKVEYKEVAGIYLARRGPQAPAASAGGQTHALSKTNSGRYYYRQPAYLLTTVVHGTVRATAADLLRPLADRSQPPRREGHPGSRASPVTEFYIRSQTARLRRGQLQRSAAGLAASLWRRTRPGLCRPCPSGAAALPGLRLWI